MTNFCSQVGLREKYKADVVERMVANSGRTTPGSTTPEAEKSQLDSEKTASSPGSSPYTLETVDYVKAAGLDANELRKTLRFTSWVRRLRRTEKQSGAPVGWTREK